MVRTAAGIVRPLMVRKVVSSARRSMAFHSLGANPLLEIFVEVIEVGKVGKGPAPSR